MSKIRPSVSIIIDNRAKNNLKLDQLMTPLRNDLRSIAADTLSDAQILKLELLKTGNTEVQAYSLQVVFKLNGETYTNNYTITLSPRKKTNQLSIAINLNSNAFDRTKQSQKCHDAIDKITRFYQAIAKHLFNTSQGRFLVTGNTDTKAIEFKYSTWTLVRKNNGETLEFLDPAHQGIFGLAIKSNNHRERIGAISKALKT